MASRIGVFEIPSTDSSRVTTPDHADFAPPGTTTAFDIRGEFLTNGNSNNQSILTQWTSAQQAFVLAHSHAGFGSIRLYWSTTGSDANSITNTGGNAPFTIGDRVQIRVVFLQDNGASQYDADFFYKINSPDNLDSDTGWTQLGSTVTGSTGTTTIHNSTGEVAVGRYNTGGGDPNEVNVYQVCIKHGATTKMYADFRKGTWLPTGNDAQSHTWTPQTNANYIPSKGALVRAELLLQAKNYVGSGDWLDESGNQHDFARTGIVWLPHVGDDYAYIPASASDSLTLADWVLPTGESEIEFDVAMSDWTPAVETDIFRKWGTSGNFELLVKLTTDGKLHYQWSTNGTATWTHVSTVATGITDGDRAVIRIECHDNGGNQETDFYVDDVKLGDTVTGGGTAPGVYNSTSTCALFGDADNIASLYSFYIRDGIAGSVNLGIDISTHATEPFLTFVEEAGKTVTINRAASGYTTTIVDQPAFLLPGLTNNWFVSNDDGAWKEFAADEDFTVLMAMRDKDYALSGMNAGAVDGFGPGSRGWRIYESGSAGLSRLEIDDGTLEAGTVGLATLVENTRAVVVGRRDTTADEIQMFDNGVGATPTEDTTTASLAPDSGTGGLYIGRIATAYAIGEVFAFAIWREALSDDEIRAASSELFENLGHSNLAASPSIAVKPGRWSINPALVAPEWRDLWRGLKIAVPFWDTGYATEISDSPGPMSLAASQEPAVVPGPLGLQHTFGTGSAGGYLTNAFAVGFPDGPVTYIGINQVDDLATDEESVVRVDDTINAGYVRIELDGRLHWNHTTVIDCYSPTGWLSAGDTFMWMIRQKTKTLGHDMYGYNFSTGVSFTTNDFPNTDEIGPARIELGYRTTNDYGSKMSLFLHHDRAITDREWDQLVRDPFGPLRMDLSGPEVWAAEPFVPRVGVSGIIAPGNVAIHRGMVRPEWRWAWR